MFSNVLLAQAALATYLAKWAPRDAPKPVDR